MPRLAFTTPPHDEPAARNTYRRKPENRPRQAAPNAAPAPSAAADNPLGLGISSGTLLLGVLAAGALAWLASGSDTPPASSTGGGQLPATPATPGASTTTPSTGTTTSTLPASLPTTSTKKPRPTVVVAATPRLMVFVTDTLLGEGIFARLRPSNPTWRDGYGLDRIATIPNMQYVGLATGKTWQAPPELDNSPGPVYMQVLKTIAGVGYNYWINTKYTYRCHQGHVAAGYLDLNNTTAGIIRDWFVSNYA